MKKITLIVIAFINLVSCSLKNDAEPSQKQTRALNKAVRHYSKDPADSLKLKALYFLIEQMENHGELSSKGIDKYRKDLTLLFKNPSADYTMIAEQINLLVPEISPMKIKPDKTEITSKFLIRHIDKAFEIYAYPWCRDLSFEAFCEYILPYRIAREPLLPWLEYYNDHFQGLIDYFSENQVNDSLKCMLAMKFLAPNSAPRKIQFSSPFDLSPVWYLDVLTNWDFANCRELSMLGMYSLRSLGLPVHWDFTPKWANASASHYWNSIEIDGKTVPFLVKDETRFGEHLTSRYYDKVSKIFRINFLVQPESLAAQPDLDEPIPQIFASPFICDVTDLYENCYDLQMELPVNTTSKFGYLLSFDNQKWTPVDWGRVIADTLAFTKVPPHNIYLKGVVEDQKMKPVGNPFIVMETGSIHEFSPDLETTHTVYISRKYPAKNVYNVFKQVDGGIFQAANKPDFTDAIDLYRIGKLEDLKPTRISFSDLPSCRYFRYLSAPNGFCNMAEIEIQSLEGRKITGEIISSDNFYTGREAENVFDGNVLSYAVSTDSTGSWVGLAFDKQEEIQTLIFTPRTDENYIVKDHQYELFYYDQDWVSLGKRTGAFDGEVLEFQHVPKNCVLLLRNYTKGREERIFVFEEGQIWY